MGQSYKDLLVWQRSVGLVRMVYKATTAFPREEMFGLTSQMRRSAVSISSNIAEGQGRLTPGEFRQFLSQARGSLMEVETKMIISSSLGFMRAEEQEAIGNEIEQVAKMLNALITSIRAGSN